MKFPDHPLPNPPFMGSTGGDGGGIFPPPPVNHPRPDSSISSYEHPPPFKRPKMSSDNMPNSVPSLNPKLNPSNHPGSKGVTHIFYKTRMCMKFLEGTCFNGERCTFAHGVEDVRKPPPNWKELVQKKDKGVGNWSDEQRMVHGLKICRKFYNGEECPYGENCNFLHEYPPIETDISRQRISSAISIGTTGLFNVNRSVSHQPESNKHVDSVLDASRPKTVSWKTIICTKWARGQCPFGERCCYAHGPSELQRPGAHAEPEPKLNSLQIPAKPLSASVIDSSPPTKVIDVPKGKNEADENNSKKWKLNRRVNGIYGDWLDDLSPPRC
ncbi:unnamed protein product [Fraxinus pennsylvanica]|uniref:C3H1-type domain-containing protein n=1 Tax=Fraxinus pennsylvanica TaxID=56036 RepID=A0AAD2DVJ4_9LAMI|nr:unnamed protein product [Fraxinus pennsylvanica]